MQSSQLPPPSNPAGPKRAGPPPRTVGQRPGAKPGPPKPKAPTPFGGKPMMPISSLIQAPAYTDPEERVNQEEEANKNGINVTDNTETESKLNEKPEDGVKEIKRSDDEPLNLDIANNNEEEELSNERRDINFNGKIEKQSDNIDVEDTQHNNTHKNREIEDAPVRRNKTVERELEEKEKDSGAHNLEENEEKPPKLEQSSPVKRDKETTHDFEDNHLELPPQGKSERNNNSIQSGPFSKAKQGPFGNVRHHDVKEEEDQDDTRDGDQNPSPVVQMGDHHGKQERIASQEEQRDAEVYEKPPMPVFFKPKTQQVTSYEASEDVNDMIATYKNPEVIKEEDVSLTLKVKSLEIELEREKRQRSAIQSEQERLLDENASLKEQLAEASSKLSALAGSNADTKDHDISKDEEIKRLKSELKSTMEGSRLITEHSNRVISESTKFKEEAEALVQSLEQEKEQLHQKFIAYKKQVQDEYAAKLIALQERERYLSEKVDEYERDINKHQGDLKHRTQTINKLASVNNEVETALSQWPTFQNVLSQIDAHTRLVEEARFQISSPVKPKHPPIKVLNNKSRELARSSERDHHVQLQQVHHHTKKDDVVEQPQNQNEQDSPFTDIVQGEQSLGIQPHKSVNDDKMSNTPETHVEDNSQDKNDDVHNKLDMDPFQGGEPVEPLDNGWGIEEPPLNENEGQDVQVQEEYREEPAKEEDFAGEPREEQYVEQPREQEPADYREEPNYQQEDVEPLEVNYEEPAHYREDPVDNQEEVEPLEVNYGEPAEYREEPAEYKNETVQPLEVNYGEPAEYREDPIDYREEEAQPLEVNYGEPTEYREDPAYHHQEDAQPLEVNYGESNEYREDPVYHQEEVQPMEVNYDEAPEYREEPVEYKQEEVQPLEVNYEEPAQYREDPVYHQEDVQPMEVNYDEAPVVAEHTENRDYEDLPPTKNETYSSNVSANAFTAVPAYRMPQKKKKAEAAKKGNIGFRPTQASYNMPDQPQDLPAEPETQQQNYDYPNSHETHVQESEGQQQDIASQEPESRPPVGHPQEVEAKPPQFVTFGRNPLKQAKKPMSAKSQPWQPTTQSAPRANAFGQTYVPQNDVHTESNGAYYPESNEINMENPPAYEHSYNGEYQNPSMQSVESVGENYGQEEVRNEINGHYQAPPAKAKKVKKAIKKKQPATGSIYS